jgi:hypothetical protein
LLNICWWKFSVRRELLLLLETGAAQHRPALGGLERHSGFRCAFRTGGAGLGANSRSAARALRLALLAVLGVIRELLIVEKQLLAGCKHELSAAIYALQDAIYKLHGRLPKEGKFTETGRNP